MVKRTLVTSALPYANGPIHMGHLVEYIQTDVFVRSQKMMGKDLIYCCADDTHGTPISINAEKAGMKPEDFVAKYAIEHQRDFKSFLIEFDSFYSTNSPENKEFSDLIFSRLKENDDIYEKEVEQYYCEHCGRFLPDRYVKGKCPKCGAEDQYGDVCEKCNGTYDVVDLVEPFCVNCKGKPVRKTSKHLFFKLSKYSDWLNTWLNSAKIQPEVRNQILNWVKEGLQDWCISRDGPYFGFQIPGTDKFYYVWLDAPIGYISSTKNYCNLNGLDVDSYWNVSGNQDDSDSRIIHVIGKDIVYFHLLFWPAVLHSAKIKLPDEVVVHGFLTVNGEKMSKSRGTFLSAQELLEMVKPEHLRFFYAASLNKVMTDIDLDLNEFKNRVNNELVSNIANFFHRSFSFLSANFEGKLVKPDLDEVTKTTEIVNSIFESYSNFEFRKAVSEILRLSSIGNSYMQANEPWKLIKEDPDKTQMVLSTCVNIAKNLAICLKPILPEYVKAIENQLGVSSLTLADLDVIIEGSIKEPEVYFRKIDDLRIGKMKFDLDLRVAKIEKIERHPEADKLYIEHLDLGNGEKRQIVSGLVPYYSAEELEGKKIILVANLEPAKLRGVMSEGMLLAGEEGETVGVLFVSDAELGTSVLPAGYEASTELINYKQFTKVKLSVKDGKAMFEDKILLAGTEEVKAERVINGSVS
ncbi:methionine--tRNA ligase [Candidatus Woesearchaeota archaeon]|nr:methionine--tRNA ligase [Candidatus Woesearchaeota archaeon]